MKNKNISIIIFSAFIFIIFILISLITIPWFFYSQHQAVGFLGIFLMLFTIPIMLFILRKKTIKNISIICYPIYVFITGLINYVFPGIIQDIVFYKQDISFELSMFYNGNFILFASIIIFLFFLVQLPIIISCLIIRKINNCNKSINIIYFIKEPLTYIFIISLAIFPYIFYNL